MASGRCHSYAKISVLWLGCIAAFSEVGAKPSCAPENGGTYGHIA